MKELCVASHLTERDIFSSLDRFHLDIVCALFGGNMTFVVQLYVVGSISFRPGQL